MTKVAAKVPELVGRRVRSAHTGRLQAHVPGLRTAVKRVVKALEGTVKMKEHKR